MKTTMNRPPLVQRALMHADSVALRTPEGETSYRRLLERSQALAKGLLDGSVTGVQALMDGTVADASPALTTRDLAEKVVAVLLPPGEDYVVAQWAVWQAGGIHLPLCLSATEEEWEYALLDSGARIVITGEGCRPAVAPLLARLGVMLWLIEITPAESHLSLPEVLPQRRAMMLYTSGTTSKPKGVVTTHANIQAQIESLIEAWEWTAADRIPLFLPLHHIHGIINVLSCALWCGAGVEIFPRFAAAAILQRVVEDAYTVFMAVPTIYVKLLEALQAMPEAERSRATAAFGRMRLMVSGSAALPASLHESWFQSTGQRLLERYGMTEIGMALSNPYGGERRPGYVGLPLPGVEVRLKGDHGEVVAGPDSPGEIQVRGAGVFREYWNQPEMTTASFDDGWFGTGDIAVVESGYYRILGRKSVDIIKSGGYKLSALEIEAVLLENPDIRECAVIGLPDETWGEAVTAVVSLAKPTASLDLEGLRGWCKHRLSVYKVPQRLFVVGELPRNAMGKVTKPLVREWVTRQPPG
jgi:malonyl-CoA/methylmalonyl-CoA synthetase